MRTFVIEAVLWLACASTLSAQPEARPSPLLEDVFKSGLTREQQVALGPQASLEQAAAALSPEQRAAAQQQLAAAESSATTPREKKEIARGYLILNERAPNAGTDALRIASELRQRNPRDPDAYTIASGAWFQQGKYGDAYEAAKAALKLNPRDPVAYTTLKLSEGRLRTSPSESPALQGVAEPLPQAAPTPPDAPYKLPIRIGKAKEVPAFEAEPSTSDSKETFGRRAQRVADAQIEKVINSLDPEGRLTEEERKAGVAGARRGAVVVATIGAVTVGGSGVAACAPSLWTGLYAVCVGAAATAGAAGGAFAGAYIGGTIGIGVEKVFQDTNKMGVEWEKRSDE